MDRKKTRSSGGGKQLDDAPAQRDDLGAQHRAVQVEGAIGGAADGLRDARMIVADGGAHLTGAEVEVGAAVHIGDGGALGPRDHRQREVAGKAPDEQPPGIGEQGVALAIAHRHISLLWGGPGNQSRLSSPGPGDERRR